MTIEQKVIKCLEVVLEKNLANESFTDLNSKAITEWDSLKQIELIVLLEEEFNVRLNEDDIIKMNSAENIVQVLKKHGS